MEHATDLTPHPDDHDDAEPTPAFSPAERKPHLLDRLLDALSSRQDQIARAQQRAAAEEQRLASLIRELNNLETNRARAKQELQKLDAEHRRLVEGRPGWLEACRANWRNQNYAGSMMAEMDYALADHPAHRSLLVKHLEAAEAAIKTFKRKHGA